MTTALWKVHMELWGLIVSFFTIKGQVFMALDKQTQIMLQTRPRLQSQVWPMTDKIQLTDLCLTAVDMVKTPLLPWDLEPLLLC